MKFKQAKLYGLLLSVLAAIMAAPAEAVFPDHPVRFIVGFAPGGGTDILARFVAQKLTEMWGSTVVVENRPGADGSIAADIVAHAQPDGYTIVWISNSHTVTPSEYKLNYDALKSFTPITIAATAPELFMVNKTVPVKTLKEFIEYAKVNPGKLNFGSSGAGSSPYLDMLNFMKRTGIVMVHVPYKGSAPAQVALLGNDIQVRFADVASTLSEIRADKLNALAITSLKRSSLLPDIPTVAEAAALPGFTGGVWFGALAPAGVPKDISDKLNADMVTAIRSPSVQEQYAKLGFETGADTSEDMANVIKSDMAKWSDILSSSQKQ